MKCEVYRFRAVLPLSRTRAEYSSFDVINIASFGPDVETTTKDGDYLVVLELWPTASKDAGYPISYVRVLNLNSGSHAWTWLTPIELVPMFD